MVELKERLQRALGRGDRKISSGMVNGGPYGGAVHSRQPYGLSTSVSRPQPSSTPNYYGQQDSFNPPVPTYPPRPTTPFQQNSWATPAASSQMPPVPPPSAVAPPPVALPPQQLPSVPPPPAASSIAPPPTTGNVHRAGPLNQRARVYVQDPSVVGSRSAGYFNSGGGSQQFGFPPQQPQQSNSSMFQPSSGQFNSPPMQQQPTGGGGFGGFNQFGTTPTLNPPFQGSSNQFITPPTGQVSNGIAFDSFHQSTPGMYNPAEFSPTPQAQGAFMQPSLFENSGSSITPPPPSGILPTMPMLPASSAAPGWNDPPPLTSFSKPKMEAALDNITHPILATGIVEQPAVPTFAAFDGTILNPGAPVVAPPPEPEPVQPPPVLLPIPNEHLIIHDVFHTLKDKCSALANNAVHFLKEQFFYLMT